MKVDGDRQKVREDKETEKEDRKGKEWRKRSVSRGRRGVRSNRSRKGLIVGTGTIPPPWRGERSRASGRDDESRKSKTKSPG